MLCNTFSLYHKDVVVTISTVQRTLASECVNAEGDFVDIQGPRYVAVYDYTASDDDEVSFNSGDFIVNVETIDDGWMTGTVESTGETGMLPSNYVEAV